MQIENNPDDSEISEAELDETSGGINTAGSKLNTIGDQGQVEQMKMQQLMDRRSKAYETLSNVMKKMSATSDNITGNMK